MNSDSDVLINRKTRSFLEQAVVLSSANLHLQADLAVTSRRDYGQTPKKKTTSLCCNKCCLSLGSGRLTFRVRRVTRRKNQRMLTATCSYCGQRQASMIIKREKRGNSRAPAESTTDEVDELDKRINASTNSICQQTIRKKPTLRNNLLFAPSLDSQPSSASSSTFQPNPKKRAKTLSKLAKLNDQKTGIDADKNGGGGGPSLLAFMNSLRR